jgi:outer membrane protein TolC
MPIRPSLSRGLLVVLVLAACAAAASCQRVRLSYSEDYVGPGHKAAEASKIAPLPKVEKPALAKAAEKPAAPQAKPTEPVSITVAQAIMTALANNQALVVERLKTPIAKTGEDVAQSQFDPAFTANLQRQRAVTVSRGGGASTAESTSMDLGFQQFFPTGTTVGVDASTAVGHGSFSGDPFFQTRVGLSVTQSLLRGYGMDVNLATLRQARLDTLSSQYELRGFAEALVAQVEEAYWDYTLAQRQIEVFTESLTLAQQQLAETEERIRVGKLAQIERAASEAEVASRRELLINARSALATARLQLLRLLNPTVPNYWSREVVIQTPPGIPDVQLEDVDSHVQLAMLMRPDLNQARLLVERGDLEIVKTRNGLLPRMDLFATLGKSGYAGTFGRSVEHMHDDGYDMLAGVNVEYPPLNRNAQALHQRATLSRRQALESVRNLAQLVEVDVRTAYVEVERAKEQVAATAVTRKLQEEKVRAEMEKFRVGKSTTLLVAQAQRDLLVSQIAEVQALVAYLKSVVEFYRLEGSLLERRGIACPGREPVQVANP